MNNFIIKKLCENKIIGNIVMGLTSIMILYLLVSLYFTKHYFFNTIVNGVNLSLKSYVEAEDIIRDYLKDYKLELIEINGENEEITGQDIQIQYNEKNSMHIIHDRQKSMQWISSVYKTQRYFVKDLYDYDNERLNNKLVELNCMTNKPIQSQNVSFIYKDGSYEVVKEKYGNIINQEKFKKIISAYISQGKKEINLFDMNCYLMPKYTMKDVKTSETKKLLNKYSQAKITYDFLNNKEILDSNMIHKWLYVDENLDAKINKKSVIQYVNDLSSIYDTVGIIRSFKTSSGKVIDIKGGLYGWKINQEQEVKTLLENIRLGAKIEREPVYSQKALSRDGNEIGSTYVEINITRQALWFYKEGKLVAHGSVVTGNPNRGNATVLGVYSLMYRQKDTTLKGPGYEVGVTYWMPFYGNIGLHDASWRSSFGGEIYKSRGTHGCVNAPYYLAKTIYENIKEGIPIIVYEEEIENRVQP